MSKQKGFTIAELLIVLVFLLIMGGAGYSFPFHFKILVEKNSNTQPVRG